MLTLAQVVKVSTRTRKETRVLKPIRPSKSLEVSYRQRLLGLVDRLGLITASELIPLLSRYQVTDSAVANDSWRDEFQSVFSRLASVSEQIQEWANGTAKQFTERAQAEADRRLKESIKRAVRVDITGVLKRTGPLQAEFDKAVAANVVLIKDIPAQYTEKLKAVVNKGMTEGVRHKELTEKIQGLLKVTRARAKLIARDQMGKLNSDFNRVRQTELGIDRYVWYTALDERVRDSHSRFHGKEYKWSEEGPDGHPGIAINCRCVALPVFDLEKE